MWIYGLIGLSIYFSLEWLSVKLLCFPSNDVLITIIDRNVQLKIAFDKSYDDSVKLKRTEMDPFRLG